MTTARLHCFLPPYLLERLLDSDDPRLRRIGLRSLVSSAALRAHRSVLPGVVGRVTAPTEGRRTIFDLQHRITLADAVVARTEEGPASADPSVNAAYEGLGTTRDFYRQVLDRDSLDGRGMRLDGYVHRGRKFNNAFWDGRHMVFGDGDGVLFTDFTGSLDVIAHELTHGVTQFTADLDYRNQSGALNESVSDVFAVAVKQWFLNQTVEEADWLIGADIFTPDVTADALRSLKAPGTAYDDPRLGKDPQPAHMRDYVDLPDTEEDDHGGVHFNSGIPNHAFYLAATKLGGHSWKAPALIWYDALLRAHASSDFADFARGTVDAAGRRYGAGSAEQEAVAAGWDGVGVSVTGP
ncbi:MAG: M4 family metallopeptidase [Kineosporiaceae bacterium]